MSQRFKCNIILSNLNGLSGFAHFESHAKTITLNCFLLNARVLVFKHKCSNTKPAFQPFLSSMKILKSSKHVCYGTELVLVTICCFIAAQEKRLGLHRSDLQIHSK